MTQQQPPRIEFPCEYSIRVLGDARDDFVDQVFDLVFPHANDLERHTLTTRDSRKGRFVSVHLTIMATGEDQLRAIHQSLLSYDAVKMVI